MITATRKKRNTEQYTSSIFFSNKNETENPELKTNNTESLIIVIVCCKKSKVISCRILGSVIFKLDIFKQEEKLCSSGAFQVEPASYYCRLESLEKLRKFEDIKLKYFTSLYWSESSSRHFLRFLSNIFKKQSRNLCFTSLLFCMNHNDLPTK